MSHRSVFFISDGTGITAETFGNAILAQFEFKPRHVRLPFVDTVDKAHQAVRQINQIAELEGQKPIVFTTLVNMEVLEVIQNNCKCMLLDMFGTFVNPLEKELGIKSHHRVGRFSDVSKSKEYHDRIEAINFSLSHDDGQLNRDLEQADVILVGESQWQNTHLTLFGHAAWLKGGQLPLDSGGFRAQSAAPRSQKAHSQNVWFDDSPRALERDQAREKTQLAVREHGQLPPRGLAGRGDDEA